MKVVVHKSQGISNTKLSHQFDPQLEQCKVHIEINEMVNMEEKTAQRATGTLYLLNETLVTLVKRH